MAVDCPDSFVARTKTPPRYPPPRPTSQSQVIFTPTGSASKPKLTSSSSSATSSFSSTVNVGEMSLELQSAASNRINHNNNHSKGSPSLDSCVAFAKKSSLKGPSSLGSTCDSIGFDSISYQTKSRGSLSTRSSSSGDLGPPDYDLGPHQERPIDVPDNFVETVKAPPRYPPPKLQIVKEIVKSKESLASNGSVDKELTKPPLTLPSPSSSSSHVPSRSNEVSSFCFPLLFYFLIHLFSNFPFSFVRLSVLFRSPRCEN